MKADGGHTFGGRKQSLIDDARRERGSGSAGSPGPQGASRAGESLVFEEKDGRATVNVLFALSNHKNAGFFKAGKIFEVTDSSDSLTLKNNNKKNMYITSLLHADQVLTCSQNILIKTKNKRTNVKFSSSYSSLTKKMSK